MWYVLQTKTGDEETVRFQLQSEAPSGLYSRCEMLLYEEVLKSGGQGHISMRRMMRGYLFIETEDPEGVHMVLRRLPYFTRILHMEDGDGADREKSFVPIEEEEWKFLDTLCAEGVLRVSYIKRSQSGRIEQIIGPLSEYADGIVKLDVPHRRAIVDMQILGKRRRIKFGLWTDRDPLIPRIERAKKDRDASSPKEMVSYEASTDIRAGDTVKDISGTYGDEQRFRVLRVDTVHWSVYTETTLFGQTIPVELMLGQVEKARDCL